MGTPWEMVLSLADEIRAHYEARHPQSDRSATTMFIPFFFFFTALTNSHRREGLKQHGCQFSQEAEWGPKGLSYGAGRDVPLEGLLAFPLF